MSLPSSPIVVIPARLSSTRLPNKPLADIGGYPMIIHVWRRALEADIGPVLVACGDLEILEVIKDFGGNAVITNPSHPSGSDRIYEALEKFDPSQNFDAVINLQGDLPTIRIELLQSVLGPLKDINVDIATLVADMVDLSQRSNPNVVKAVLAMGPGGRSGRALYFSRSAVPWCSDDGDNNKLVFYHHIGIYAYRREVLKHFVSLPPGQLEKREMLEQLRALEDGMVIHATRVDTIPLGVDTFADLECAREILAITK
ncbi:MAG: 3-deoxy-manno-octulosonate cytidylyltransferase [Rhodospirillaceae bacterium TMED8]|nr:3-deoxy-manno-octulosonate cytidylyltransferase [Magnetovibrio sp.]OUT53250.1 MAG: 3-deoxy-manno-octulosonate cytidylyltransferase [Rhodospirillaceae bacterium TMED8]